MRRNIRIIGILAAPLPVLALAVPANAASPAVSGRVVLSGAAVPGLAKATHTGALASSQRLSLEVSLTPRNQDKLAAFIRAVSDPKSSSYKHYLTVAQYAAEYGATDAQVQAVSSYLRSAGLSVGQVTANHLTLSVGGTAAQVEKAFDVSIGTYQTSSRSFYANEAAPSLPSSIASVVSGVAGLSTSSVRTAAYGGPARGHPEGDAGADPHPRAQRVQPDLVDQLGLQRLG